MCRFAAYFTHMYLEIMVVKLKRKKEEIETIFSITKYF